MKATWRVLQAEWTRMQTLASTWIVLALVAGAAGLRASVSALRGAAERGGTSDPLTSGTGWAPFVDGWRAGLVLATLVLLAQATRGLAGDREHGVLRLAVTRSAPRWSLVVGRLFLAPAPILGLVASTGLAAYFAARAQGDFGPLIEDGYEILSAAELRYEIARGAFAVLPALWAMFAFGILIGALVRGTTLAVTVALGGFMAFDLFKEGLGDAQAWVFASHVPSLVDSSAWSELQGVARGFSDAGFSDGAFRAALVTPWPAIVLCALVAVVLLRRKPL